MQKNKTISYSRYKQKVPPPPQGKKNKEQNKESNCVVLSITLGRDALQQGDVVSLQHDPTCERTENERGRNLRMGH